MLNMLSNDQKGFILVWALLLLVVVTLLGAAGISTSIFEENMAANEALHKIAFYEADGGTENALALLVENINCITGFSDTSVNSNLDPTSSEKMNYSAVALEPGKQNFWLTNNYLDEIDMPTEGERDFYYPRNYQVTGEPYTHGRINGRTTVMTGANLPMLAGYEGKGKALGQDGAFLQYDIKTEYIGARNNDSRVHIKFRLDNQFASYPSGSCKY